MCSHQRALRPPQPLLGGQQRTCAQTKPCLALTCPPPPPLLHTLPMLAECKMLPHRRRSKIRPAHTQPRQHAARSQQCTQQGWVFRAAAAVSEPRPLWAAPHSNSMLAHTVRHRSPVVASPLPLPRAQRQAVRMGRGMVSEPCPQQLTRVPQATNFGGTGFGAAATAAAQGTTAQPLSAGPTMGQPDLPQGSAPAPLGGTGFGAGFAAPAAPQAEPAAREGQIRAGTEGGRGGGQRRQGASLHARQQAGVRVDCPSWMQQREPSSPAAQQRDERQKQREQRRAELQQQAERRKAPAVRDGSPRARNMELDTPADLGGSASAGCEAAPAQARAGAARQSGGGETPRWEGTQLLSLATQYVMDALEVRRREAVRMLQPIFQQHSPSWAAAYLLGREGAMRVLPSIVSRVIDRQLGIPGYGVGSDTSSNSGSDSRRNGHSSHPWSPHRPNTPGSRSARARCDAVGNAPGAQGHRR